MQDAMHQIKFSLDVSNLMLSGIIFNLAHLYDSYQKGHESEYSGKVGLATATLIRTVLLFFVLRTFTRDTTKDGKWNAFILFIITALYTNLVIQVAKKEVIMDIKSYCALQGEVIYLPMITLFAIWAQRYIQNECADIETLQK